MKFEKMYSTLQLVFPPPTEYIAFYRQSPFLPPHPSIDLLPLPREEWHKNCTVCSSYLILSLSLMSAGFINAVYVLFLVISHDAGD